VRPFSYLFGVVEIPVLAGYTWFLRGDFEAERNDELARDDDERVAANRDVFSRRSHFFAMAGPHSRGLRLYDRFLDVVESQAPVRYCTTGELVHDVERGTVPVAW
jgi:hypothetical protein